MLPRILKFAQSHGLAATAGHIFSRVRQSLVPPVRQVFSARLADFALTSEFKDHRVRVQAFHSPGAMPAAVLEGLLSQGTIDDRRPHSRETVTAFMNWLFSRGAEFWACYEDSSLVGYLWSLRGSRELPRCHFFPLGAQDAVFLAHEIFPAYRGRELNRKMTHLVLGEMKARGIERVYVDVLLTNKRSLKSFSKTLFVPVGQARMKMFKNRQVVIWRHRGKAAPAGPDQKG